MLKFPNRFYLSSPAAQEEPGLVPTLLGVLLLGGAMLASFEPDYSGKSRRLGKFRSRAGSWFSRRIDNTK